LNLRNKARDVLFRNLSAESDSGAGTVTKATPSTTGTKAKISPYLINSSPYGDGQSCPYWDISLKRPKPSPVIAEPALAHGDTPFLNFLASSHELPHLIGGSLASSFARHLRPEENDSQTPRTGSSDARTEMKPSELLWTKLNTFLELNAKRLSQNAEKTNENEYFFQIECGPTVIKIEN
jgi:hypothetical protein